MIVLRKNESLLNQTDSKNKKKWVNCNMVVKDCSVNYWAKKEEDDEVYVMIKESCNDKDAGAQTAAPTGKKEIFLIHLRNRLSSMHILTEMIQVQVLSYKYWLLFLQLIDIIIVQKLARVRCS